MRKDTETHKVLLLDLDRGDRSGPLVVEMEQFVSEVPVRFEQYCLEPLPAASPQSEIRLLLERLRPELVFIAFGSLPFRTCFPVVQSLRATDPDLPILLAGRKWHEAELIGLLNQGWTDFVNVPFRAVDVFPRMVRLLSQGRRQNVPPAPRERLGLVMLLGKSPVFLEEIRKIPFLARCDATVLISGETGTGKELCAKAIHHLSARSGKPFLGVNCGAIPPELIENELFGHDREAFTGATSCKTGLIGESDSGTLFLDEVDSLSLAAQVKLLRFLQEKEYRQLGSAKIHKVDVRIIAASNVNLEQSVTEGRLRKDLYYRLNILSLNLPSLRQRREDVTLLLGHFLEKYAKEYHAGPLAVSPEAIQALTLYAWPGNVRQLEHVVQRAVLLAQGPLLGSADFDLPVEGRLNDGFNSFQQAKSRLIRDFERDYIHSLLIMHKGNVSQAAKSAQKNRRAFWQLVQKHGIEVANYRLSGRPEVKA